VRRFKSRSPCVTTLGPEGPSFRPRGRLLPVSGRQSGSIHRPSPEILRLGLMPTARMFFAALTSASKIDPQLVQTKREQIALRDSVRHVNMTISLAFLAPKLVHAAVEGRLPRGINIARLRDAPAEWSRQFEALGLNPQQ
jgi:site-specific DNA recombinase